jgi:hypothetical protein
MEEATVREFLAVLAVIMLAASAGATVTVGAVNCGGAPPNETCSVQVNCGAGDCQVTNSTQFNATCTATPSGPPPTNQYVLGAAHLSSGPDPVCEWSVTDEGDSDNVNVTIDGSDGLPVELLSFTIDDEAPASE